ncbi:hypothetical protein HRI_001832300 [Hibiscus trionum]|uniref:C2H2-type domain-containing protein n=1 Tax=Hibiscus trionum TaxID=183268 RepID=A0A9W7HPC7_HIBTR|nr:hypothetical protein HRI_001832300 [Hibiscus trionum]
MSAAAFVFSARNYLKSTHKTEVMERGGETESPPKDSRIKFCSYCRRGFKSSKALYGHLRIHCTSQTQARSKTGILHVNSPERGTKRSPEEDEGFSCLVCNQSFSSMQLLCRHMRIHRGTVSNTDQQPPVTSQESTAFQSNDHNVDLLKDMPGWSQCGKSGLKKIASDDDIFYDAVPSRFDHRPAEHPRKKKKTKENMAFPNPDTSMEGAAADSESTVELLNNRVTSTKNLEAQNCNKPNKSRSRHGRRSMKNAKAAAEREHRCKICGKTFATGQALGGHKTCHRMKDPLKVKLVQPKIEQGSCVELRECVTRMLLPGLLPEEPLLPEHAPPKKMLQFDLNIPYQE